MIVRGTGDEADCRSQVHQAENEDVVREALRRCPALELDEALPWWHRRGWRTAFGDLFSPTPYRYRKRGTK